MSYTYTYTSPTRIGTYLILYRDSGTRDLTHVHVHTREEVQLGSSVVCCLLLCNCSHYYCY